MDDARHLLSSVAGDRDLSTKKFFKGVFSLDTLPLADNLVDLNKPNLFFVYIDGVFITVFNTPTRCFVLDGVNGSNYPDSLQRFINVLSEGVPIITLPHRLIDRSSSMIFSLLMGVLLSKSPNISIQSIINQLGLHVNSITRNKIIVSSWFRDRYHTI